MKISKKAFTLVELVVVLLIISVLAVLGFINYSNYVATGRDSKIIEDLEYESYTQAVPTISFTEDPVWKMLKTINGMEDFKRYFNFENGKASVEAYPNDESKLFLEILDLSNMKTNLKTSLNFKYVDLWFKGIKGDKFNMAIGKNNRSAIKFSKENTDYIVMPLVLR